MILGIAPSRLCFGENNGRACRVEWGGAFTSGTCISVVVAQIKSIKWRVENSSKPFYAIPTVLFRRPMATPTYYQYSFALSSVLTGADGGNRHQFRRRGGQRLSADTYL